MTAVMDAIDRRDLGKKGVAAYLDGLPIADVAALLDDPHHVTEYAAVPGWKVGDGKPDLADDDPATMQAMGRCLASRISGRRALDLSDSTKALGDYLDPYAGAIHPKACGWCDLPVDELVKACAWAAWSAHYVVTRLDVWHGIHGSRYVRSHPTGYYENPRHAEWWALDAFERATRIQRVVEASRA